MIARRSDYFGPHKFKCWYISLVPLEYIGIRAISQFECLLKADEFSNASFLWLYITSRLAFHLVARSDSTSGSLGLFFGFWSGTLPIHIALLLLAYRALTSTAGTGTGESFAFNSRIN